MTIPFPEDDGPGRGVADFLLHGQRLLGPREIAPAMLMVRKAVETPPGDTPRGGTVFFDPASPILSTGR